MLEYFVSVNSERADGFHGWLVGERSGSKIILDAIQPGQNIFQKLELEGVLRLQAS